MIERNRLHQIANMLYPAAMQQRIGKPDRVRDLIRANARLPLGQYLVRLFDFVAAYKMDTAAAVEFSRRLGDAEVFDMIFVDALPLLEKGAGPMRLTVCEIAQLWLVRDSAIWYSATAREYGDKQAGRTAERVTPVRANDNWPGPMPA